MIEIEYIYLTLVYFSLIITEYGCLYELEIIIKQGKYDNFYFRSNIIFKPCINSQKNRFLLFSY